MRGEPETLRRARRRALGVAFGSLWAVAQAVAAAPEASCARPVYLTFDTGHMGVAEHIAEVLKRQQVRATFFLADERTREGGSSLDDRWAPWWRARAAEGHAFGSHTWQHLVWQGDAGPKQFTMRPTAGPNAGRRLQVSAAEYCADLQRVGDRFREMTGQTLGPWFRAPAGRHSAALREAAAACGFTHIGWSDAGFLGDELPSDRYPNAALLQRALRDIRPGDVLMAHLGIWSRQDPWAPAVLEPLIAGLKARGLCFATLDQHPKWGRATPLPR